MKIKTDAIDYEDVISRIQGIYNQATPEEKDIFRDILIELSDTGYSQTLETVWLQDFLEVPVSIDTFLNNSMYLGNTNRNGEAVYPFWRDTMNEIFNYSNAFSEIIFSGATRIGKTSTAISAVAYMLYRLMIYRDPHEYFKKKAVSKFTVAFCNLTKELALGVGFTEFSDTIKLSPWFNDRGKFNRSVKNPTYFPNGDKIEIIAASSGSHLLGKQLWCALMDEVNFTKSGVKDINKAKVDMEQMYHTANARITGTFKINGIVYGKLFTCSSKNSDSDYLSGHIETQQNAGNSAMYVVDKPQWEVLPSSMFGKEKFYITVGDRYKRGFVVPTENEDYEHIQAYRDQGFQILEVPIDFKSNFLADYDIALRDIAGISVVGAMGFITQESVTCCVTEERKNPFFLDVLECGIKDNETLERNFHLEVVPNRLKSLPMHIHIDFAEVSDHTGVCGVVPDGTKKILDPMTLKNVVLPFFKQIFQIAIAAPRGDRMSFQKIINFIVWLRRNGFNIVSVSTDQYQSSYVRQTLDSLGFNTKKISVDSSIDPYIGLRNILQDQRIELVKHQLQEDELVHLQRINNRVDHPPQGSSSGNSDGGSKGIGKDSSDALCGAVWSLIEDQGSIQAPTSSVVAATLAANSYRGDARVPSVLAQQANMAGIFNPFSKRK